MLRTLARFSLLLPLFLTVSQAQTITQSSPQATTLAQESLQAAVGATALTDVTLQGTVNYTAGSDEETGTFALELKGNQESKLALNLSGGSRAEIRQGFVGARVDATGVQRPMGGHNCIVDASTLFPTFSMWGVLNDPQVIAVDLGPELKYGASVDHLRLTRLLPDEDPDSAAEIQMLSTLDIFLDSASHLPVWVQYNTYTDRDERFTFPIDVQFSDYRLVNGVLVPFHVQKFIQRTLWLDLYVSNVAINSGISDSEFAIQPTGGSAL